MQPWAGAGGAGGGLRRLGHAGCGRGYVRGCGGRGHCGDRSSGRGRGSGLAARPGAGAAGGRVGRGGAGVVAAAVAAAGELCAGRHGCCRCCCCWHFCCLCLRLCAGGSCRWRRDADGVAAVYYRCAVRGGPTGPPRTHCCGRCRCSSSSRPRCCVMRRRASARGCVCRGGAGAAGRAPTEPDVSGRGRDGQGQRIIRKHQGAWKQGPWVNGSHGHLAAASGSSASPHGMPPDGRSLGSVTTVFYHAVTTARHWHFPYLVDTLEPFPRLHNRATSAPCWPTSQPTHAERTSSLQFLLCSLITHKPTHLARLSSSQHP